MSTDSIMIDNVSTTSLNNSGPTSNENSVNNSRYNLFRGFSYVADLELISWNLLQILFIQNLKDIINF